MKLNPIPKLSGSITVPGDKSISHRSVIFGALSDGICNFSHFLMSDDCRSTIDCFRKMGVKIEVCDDNVRVHGVGIAGLSKPSEKLYTGNSGTTTRLLCGLLSAQKFDSSIDGDESIRTRPMARVETPLTQMGAKLKLTNDNFCPIEISGAVLSGIDYTLPVASAQLKSALVLAGLYADGETVIREKTQSRNHTENMLKALGTPVDFKDKTITVKKASKIKSFDLAIPGDISSAAFFIVAALIVPNSEIILKNVGLNPTRAGIIDVLIKMGADITILSKNEEIEPSGDLLVKTSELHGIDIGGEIIPNIIDELPIIAVAAAYADGETIIHDANELRHKESDRISAMCDNLKSCGVDITEKEDGMIIRGGKVFGGNFKSYNDHRIAMSMAVCALAAASPSELFGEDCISISYPTFFEDLNKLKG